MLILSICIPSYNRFNAIQKNLGSILQAKSNLFEVVIVDNCSSSDLGLALKIKDPRVRIIRRTTPVYGPRNVGECLGYARGKYALLCLDKDYVNGEYLDNFIQCLQKYPDICGGYCGQDWGIEIKAGDTIIYEENALREFAYLSKHPSGDFYRMDCIRYLYCDLRNPLFDDSFCFDLLLAECASCGKMMKFTTSLITVESQEDSLKIKSLSFSKTANNLFFFPANRIYQFNIFCKHLDGLQCNNKSKWEVIPDLYRRTLVQTTIGFRFYMMNTMSCTHYKVLPRKVSFMEMIKWWWKFNRAFCSYYICSMPLKKKLIIIGKVHISLIVHKLNKMWCN